MLEDHCEGIEEYISVHWSKEHSLLLHSCQWLKKSPRTLSLSSGPIPPFSKEHLSHIAWVFYTNSCLPSSASSFLSPTGCSNKPAWSMCYWQISSPSTSCLFTLSSKFWLNQGQVGSMEWGIFQICFFFWILSSALEVAAVFCNFNFFIFWVLFFLF